MKKIVIVFGLISGTISATLMGISMVMCYKNPDYGGSMVVGFASMILAFSLIFVGVKTFRDKHNGGVVSFVQAFTIGLFISLIASTMYVATWAIMYHQFMPDFMDGYNAHHISKIRASGASMAVINEEIAELERGMENYKNPIYFTLMTYVEIFPVGLIISLFCAFVMKRKIAAEPAR